MAKTFRRILSAMLVICMFVGLLPQITVDFSTAQAAAADVYYNFTKANTGTYGADVAAKRAHFASLTYDAVAACNPNASSGEWAYHSYTCTSEDGTEGSSYVGYGYETGLGFIMSTASRKNEMHTAVKMKVPNAGKYVPFINLHGGYFPGYVGVITANFREINSDGTLGTTLASKKIHTGGVGATNDFTAISDVSIELEAKEYALEVVIDNEREIVIVSGLRLRAATSTTTVSFTIDDNVGYVEVNVGETVTLPMVVMGSNGKKYPCANSNNWGYTENNPYVTLSLDKYSETVSFTGVMETTTPQLVEFTNGYAQGRIHVVVKPAGYVKPAEDLYYDFKKVLADYVTVNHKHNMTNLLTYAMSTPGAYGEINKWTGKDSETSIKSAPWAFSAIDDTVKFSPLFHNYGIRNMGIGVTDIKIRVPVSGTYRPYLNIPTAYPTNTPVIMSILDENGAVLTEKEIAPASGGNMPLSDTALKLEKGEYIVRFNKTEIGTNADAGSNYYDGINLYYVEEATHEDVVYDFKKAWNGDTTADYVKTITYDMTTSGSATELNPDKVSAPWAFLKDDSTGGNSYFKYNYSSYGLCKSLKGTATLKIKVPVSGYYIPYANLYYNTTGNAVVTLKHYDAATDTVGDKIAQLNTPVSTTETKDYAFGGKIFLVKGEYALEITAANVSRSGVIINALKLIATDSDELGSIDVDLKANYYNDSIGFYTDYPEMNTDNIKVTLYSTTGEDISSSAVLGENYSVTYTSSDPSVATVNSSGKVTAYKLGQTTISVTATLYGITKKASYTFEVVTGGKNRRSYYREDKVAAMRENATKYSFAKNTMNNAVKNSAKYLENPEKLWNSVTSQELPRSYYTTYRADPAYSKCHYCGVDLVDKYGSPYYAWEISAWNNPWKITCPDCNRDFPSNDFGSFYELGINPNGGEWSYELAKSENAKLVAAGEPGYLVNSAYPEKGTGWGVDDGYGYVSNTTFKAPNGDTVKSTHTYISFYNHWGVWHTSLLYNAIGHLKNAYIYTGDIEYGRVGAILIDRIADVYPEMTTAPYRYQFTDSANYAPQGKVSDYIWENQLAERWAAAYDAFWPAYEDEEVISISSARAKKYNMANDKTTAAKIRKNCEDGILREIYKCAQNGKIGGNFGMYQSTLAIAAVALDTEPETVEMLDWIFQDGEQLMVDGAVQVNKTTGGNVNRQLFDAVDANGIPDEVAPNYNQLWVESLYELVQYLAGYDKYPECDLYNHPKYMKMNTVVPEMLMRRWAMPQIGDSGATAKDEIKMLKDNNRYVHGFMYTKDPIFAQVLYMYNGFQSTGLHYPADHPDPMSLADEVQAIIDRDGLFDYGKSRNLTDYGYAAMRYPMIGENEETETTYWMFYGRGAGHGHRDALNLGIDAKGLAVAPDLGYPTSTTGYEYASWGQTTTSHNTVVVNDGRQFRVRTTGFPHHFDDAGRVKVMDASAEHQYSIEDYRRTVVSIGIDEDDTYAVDFFHVNGGNEHLYSFHALADTVTTSGLTLTPQKDSSGKYVGTYAGADVPFETYQSKQIGYTYLYNVDRDATVTGGNFAVDFQIEDYRGVRDTVQDTHLKMTMLNGFDLNEVALADGNAPKRDLNPEKLKFVLARRSGTNLNSLFTTVFETYNDNSNISSITAVTVKRADGATMAADEKARAVKVVLKNGRTDYITFANKTNVEYNVDNLFNVKGFVSVYSLENGVNTYSYINDGTKVGSLSTAAAYTGTIKDFTKGSKFENSLTVSFNGTIDPQNLVGRYLYVDENSLEKGNSTYEILGVTKSGNNYVLDIGNITLIDKLDTNGDFVYMVDEGDTFRVPLSAVKAVSKVTLATVGDKSVTAGDKVEFTLSATSSMGNPIAYSSTNLPEGATLDVNTGKVTWTPTTAQVGDHTINFTANDGYGSASTTVKVTVKAPTSTVTLSEGGTVVATYGEPLHAITPPTKAGSIFNGYYDAESGGTKYYDANGTSVKAWDKTGDVTLYAQWTVGEVTFTATGDKSITALSELAFNLSASSSLGSAIAYSCDSLPDGATLTTAGGFSWTPTLAQVGTHNITFKATDGYNTATVTTKVTVNAPESNITFAEISAKEVVAENKVTFTVSATSSLNQTVLYTATNLPDGATFIAGVFNWTPTVAQIGEHTITFTATDGYGSATKAVNVTVKVPTSTVTLSEGGVVVATYGEAMPKIDVPTKTGYIFAGYFDEENGTGNMYYKADGESARTWDKTGDVTLYANWIQGEVTITQIEDKVVVAEE
ncbi:MAG: heparinase II/III family protein, partial [Clostridia bacterium]|nr:heparinase II/III family protein [Clostridia bacterium]